MRLFIMCSLIVVLSCVMASASVWTVGPGGDYAQIQQAVDAAADRDTLLVYPGTYNPVVIDGKALSIAADGVGVVVDGGVVVQNLVAGSAVVLVGMEMVIQNEAYEDHEALYLTGNLGSVRVEDCTCSGGDGWWYLDPWTGFYEYHYETDALYVENTQDAAFVRCTLNGGDGMGGYYDFGGRKGRAGLKAQGSTIALYDCTLYGGHGGDNTWSVQWAGDGGNGYEGESDLLFASGCLFVGGDGGYGKYFAGDGGDGIALNASSQARLLDNTCQGGDGGGGLAPGQPGQGISGGAVQQLPGIAHTFEFPCPVRENQMVTVSFTGEPGDYFGVFISHLPGTLFIPEALGQMLVSVDPFPRFFYLGVLPPSGALSWDFKWGDKAPGFIASTSYYQVLFMDAVTDQLTLGTLRSCIVLNEIY